MKIYTNNQTLNYITYNNGANVIDEIWNKVVSKLFLIFINIVRSLKHRHVADIFKPMY